MKKIFLFYLACLVVLMSSAQKTDRKLQQKMEAIVKGFNGTIGVYIKELKTGKEVMYNSDTIFPTASIVKVPILLGVMDKINKGELQYEQEMIYKDSLLYEGEDILGSFKSNEKILLKKVMMLMLTTSDNTASLWLQSLAGKGTRINEILDSLGFINTRVNSRTPGRENNRTQYGWGQTTPKEMALLFEKIYKKEIINEAACDRMMRCLGRNYWDLNEAISQIPPTIEVFSKNGCVDATRNEVLLVNAPHHPFLFSIFTKNNTDQRWEHDNEAWTLTRKLAAMLWHYYEPNISYSSPQQ